MRLLLTQIKNTTILAKIVKKLLAWPPFESAMVVLKELNAKTNEKKETLIKLDAQYDSYLQEASL